MEVFRQRVTTWAKDVRDLGEAPRGARKLQAAIAAMEALIDGVSLIRADKMTP